MSGPVTLQRRLANLRANLADADPSAAEAPERARRRTWERASAIAACLGADLESGAGGSLVVRRTPPRRIPVDREALAGLPGGPPPGVPLVCLDTETTGLATAAGTLAFLVGLGWWVGDDFHQAQLLVPDHPDEPAMLDALAGHVPPNAWLVTYNGRGFDWPLIVARFRLALRAAPEPAGHLDLLPLARRIFRHRLPDARLRSVEEGVLGIRREGDVGGWEIPGRYLDVLRGGPPELLVDIVRHNDQDVRSLARLVALLGGGLARRSAWPGLDRGDLAGLGRAFRIAGRLSEALDAIEAALAAPDPPVHRVREAAASAPWWQGEVDVPRRARSPAGPAHVPAAAPWNEERLLIEQAHLLRRLGCWEEAAATWAAVGAGPGRIGVLAWIEVAKLREHRLADIEGALTATDRARRALIRRRQLGWPEPAIEAALAARLERLARRRLRIA
jgi:hypothetical protein